MNKTVAHALLTGALLAISLSTTFAATLRVGPGRTYTQLSQVAAIVNPGDVIEVDGNATYGAVLWTRSGTAAQPITVRGMAQGTQRPVINAGGGPDAFRMDVNHYVIEDLVISNASTRCVYLRGTNLTLRRVAVHTCTVHGILGSDTLTGDTLITEVEVYNQGNPASPQDGHHPIYVSTDQVAYPNAVLRIEKSWIHDNFSGNAIKSRAKTVKVFHNWIEATNAQASVLELIGPDPDGVEFLYPPGQGLCPVPDGTNDAQLCTGEVVGNVLIARGTRAFMMRLGSDATGHSRGRYHVVNNAFIAGGAFASGGAMIRAFGPIQSIELHNNIFWMHNGDSTSYRIVRDRDAGGVFEAEWVNGKRVTGSRNLVTGVASAYNAEPAATAISGLTNTVFATTSSVFANLAAGMVSASQAYLNLATMDLRLPSTSSARRMGNAGSTSTAGYQIPNPTNLPAFYPPMLRPASPASGSAIPAALRRPKPTSDAGFVVANETSIGPFEYVFVPAGLDAAADEDNDGVPNGVEAGEGLNVLTKDNDIFTSARLFAMQQYRDFLGREGEPAGIEFYDNLITQGGAQRVPVIESFLGSPEFQNGLPQVTRLYFSFFNRIPDYPGLIFQLGAYRAGTPLEAIAQNFYNSPEFTNTYGALTNDQYINLVYQNVLGRAPDPAGYDYYFTRLESGVLTKGQMMIGFSESPEFQQLMSDEVYVVSVYVGMLRRTPEPAGLAFYVQQIEAGTPRGAIINGFFGSPEYAGRFLP